MSLKQPYLDVRGLSADEAYKQISDCLDKHFAYRNKKAFPKYRFQQILNAITHASLSDEQSIELKRRVSQLREIRNAEPEYKQRSSTEQCPSPKRVKRKFASPIARRLHKIITYDDLKFLMSTSFLNTVKSDDDFAVLKSTIARCTTEHEEDRNLWLKTIEQRKAALKQIVKPKRSAKFIPPKPILIYVPNGGMPTYKRKR